MDSVTHRESLCIKHIDKTRTNVLYGKFLLKTKEMKLWVGASQVLHWACVEPHRGKPTWSVPFLSFTHNALLPSQLSGSKLWTGLWSVHGQKKGHPVYWALIWVLDLETPFIFMTTHLRACSWLLPLLDNRQVMVMVPGIDFTEQCCGMLWPDLKRANIKCLKCAITACVQDRCSVFSLLFCTPLRCFSQLITTWVVGRLPTRTSFLYCPHSQIRRTLLSQNPTSHFVTAIEAP